MAAPSPSSSSIAFWNTKYAGEDYFYGEEPNTFVVEAEVRLPRGSNVLCLAEGEGRNAVYLAGCGHRVTAVDMSSVGLGKLSLLAAKRGLEVTTIISDLAEFTIAPGEWDGIISIWAHVPHSLRRSIHVASVAGLRKGGVFVFEAYHPRQLEFKTGGPQTTELLATISDVSGELAGLEVVLAQEIERDVREGKGHFGMSAVTEFIGKKV